MARVIPETMMPKAASFKRIHAHWTAGNHKSSADDRTHYHFVIDGDGTFHQGVKLPSMNSLTKKSGKWAYHTLSANTGALSISVACMGGAVERPFNSGRFPMTKVQWDKMILAIADLCEAYKIPVGPTTVLSHAEVQGNLGIKQKGKWDFTRLSFDPSVVGAKACGDKMRREVQDVLSGRIVRLFDEGDFGEPEDGGEPDEPIPTISSGIPEWAATMADTTGESLHWTSQMVKAGYPDGDWQIFEAQTRLKGRKYSPGVLDGKWGGGTAGAIAAFVNDSVLAGRPIASPEDFRELRPELIRELKAWEAADKFRPVAEDRKEAKPQVVDQVAPEHKEIKSNMWTKIWTTVVAAFGLVFNWISDRVEWAIDKITGGDGGSVMNIVHWFKSIPTSFWIILGIGLLAYFMLKDKLALEKIEEDVKSGERV
jgi:hypothetical protein